MPPRADGCGKDHGPQDDLRPYGARFRTYPFRWEGCVGHPDKREEDDHAFPEICSVSQHGRLRQRRFRSRDQEVERGGYEVPCHLDDRHGPHEQEGPQHARGAVRRTAAAYRSRKGHGIRFEDPAPGRAAQGIGCPSEDRTQEGAQIHGEGDGSDLHPRHP